MENLLLTLLSSLTYIIPQLVIIAACIYYLVNKVSADSILLTIGSVLGLILMVFNGVVIPFLYSENIVDLFGANSFVYSITGAIGFLASIIFAIGLFILVNRVVKEKKQAI